MIPRPGLLFLLLSFAPLCGQTTGAVPDSTRSVPGLPTIMTLPVWTPPGNQSAGGALPDTLRLEYPASRPVHSTWLKSQRWLGLGMMAVFGTLSYHYHQQAEATYQAYLTSGNPAELDDLFDKTQHQDRRAGYCFLGAEAGLVLVAFSFILDP